MAFTGYGQGGESTQNGTKLQTGSRSDKAVKMVKGPLHPLVYLRFAQQGHHAEYVRPLHSSSQGYAEQGEDLAEFQVFLLDETFGEILYLIHYILF